MDTRFYLQLSGINDFQIDILTMTSTDIFIEKFIWLNYNHLLGEIAHLSKQKQIYGIVMRKYEQPEDLTENDTTAEKFPKSAEAQN